MANTNNFEISVGPSREKKSTASNVGKITTPTKPTELAPLKIEEPATTYSYTPHQRTTGGGGDNSTVTSRTQAFREADAGNWNQIQEQQAMQRIAEVETSNIQTFMQNFISRAVAERQGRRALGQFSMNLSKSSRYRQMASNLTTLASGKLGSAADKDNGFAVANGIIGAVGTVAGAIIGGVAGAGLGGAIAGAVNGFINIFNDSDKDREKAELYAQMQQNITAYMANLTNRDSTIMNTMDQIYSSMDTMRATYGAQFVDTMYNYFLAKSGMTSDAYSLLTGNFNTFEGIGYGQVSADGQIFDTLTDGNQNLFNNIYAQLQLGDITGNQSLLDNMVQSLYGADTELAMTLRGYENDLRTAIKSSLNQQSQAIWQTRGDLAGIGVSARSENISSTEEIGSAEAELASSGLRGGTTGNNAALARLSRDLGQIQYAANVASVIGTMKYNIQNAQLNASSTAYSYRIAQKKAVNNALNSSILSFNSIGRSSMATEREANYYITEAQAEQRQFEQKFENMAENDKNRIFEVTQG